MEDKRHERSWSLEEIKRMRDELRVQMNLAGKELRDDWEAVESKWNQLNRRMHPVKEAASDSASEIGKATKDLMREIGNTYQRIKNAL